MGPPLHRVSGAAGPGRALTLPAVLLLATPDDYLLELERRDLEHAWQRANPEGEIVVLSPTPPAAAVIQELVNRSLFAAARLISVPDAAPFVAGRTAEEDAAPLAEALNTLGLDGVTVLFAAAVKDQPSGPLADAVSARGELRWLPLPEAPKPWDDLRLSAAQRAVLIDLLTRLAPGALSDGETVEALLSTYGFSPRKLVQAAQSLAASGTLSADAVRIQAGPGEVTVRDLEDRLAANDRAGAARTFAVLSAGGRLVGWHGETVDDDKVAGVLAGLLGRLLRQGLALRVHAERAGLGKELDGRRCADRSWYPRVFKPRLAARLAAEIEATPSSPLAGLTPWQLHRVFRFAAWFDNRRLLAALANLDPVNASRERGPVALAELVATVVGMFSEPTR